MSSTTKKALAVLALIILCVIPTLFVMAIVADRQSRNEEVRMKIGTEFGYPQEFQGPVALVPYFTSSTIDGKKVETAQTLYVFPKSEDLTVELSPSEKQRGIFRIPVYGAKVTGLATFEVPPADVLAGYGYGFDWAKVKVGFPITDVRSIDPESMMKIDGTLVQLMQGSGVQSLGEAVQGVHVKAPLGSKKTFVVDMDIRVNGTERFSFVPAGTVTTARVTSVWDTPSFTGAYLPTQSEVGEKGFDASWRVSGLGRTFPEIASSESFAFRDLSASMITVGLFDGVDQYTLTSRAVKYAILFIALTFMTFFFVEVLHALRVHPIQYALIGAALALFYLLLLSLSEQIAFGKAYLIAATLTTLLIASYAYFVLHARKYALLIGAILASLYGYLFLVLRSEDYALISGTLLLFCILATTMYITRKVDWYSLDR